MTRLESLLSWIKHHKVRLSLLLGYALLSLPFYLWPHLVPDEKDFFHIANNINHRMVQVGIAQAWVAMPNLLGYGPIYWSLYGLLVFVTEQSWLIMRLIGWAAMVSVPVGVWVLGKTMKSSWTTWVIGLWCAFPMAWWIGKLSGPEPLSLAAMMWAVVFFYRERHRDLFWSGLLLGLAIAIKLSHLPLGVFLGGLLLIDMVYKQRSPQLVGVWVLGGILGGLIATPSIVMDLSGYIGTIQKYGASAPFTWSRLGYVLFTQEITWDRIASFGILKTGIVVWSLPVWVWALYQGKVPRKTLFTLATTFVVLVLMVVTRKSFMGWYALSLIPIVLCLSLMVKKTAQTTRLMLIVLVIQAVFTIPHFLGNYREKYEANQVYADRYQIAGEMIAWLAPRQVDVVVDWSEFTFMMPYDKWFHTDGPKKLYTVYRAEKWFASPVLRPQEGAVILVGDRLLRGQEFADVKTFLRVHFPNRHIDGMFLDRVSGYYLFPE